MKYSIFNSALLYNALFYNVKNIELFILHLILFTLITLKIYKIY